MYIITKVTNHCYDLGIKGQQIYLVYGVYIITKVTDHCHDIGIKGHQIYLKAGLLPVTQAPLVFFDRGASCFVH